MSNCFCYEINTMKYKKTNTTSCFLINGWCFSKTNTEVDFVVKINGKESDFNSIPLQRIDIFKKYKNEIDSSMIGFNMRIPCQADVLDSLEIVARDKQGNEEALIQLDANAINGIKDISSLEYEIESYQGNKADKMSLVLGWVYSLDGKNIDITIVDSKDTLVDSTIREVNRNDVEKTNLLTDKDKCIGYQITFDAKKSEKYFIVFTTDADKLKVDLNQLNVSKVNLAKAYLTNINAENIRKATTYLKRNGLKGFLNRLKYGVAKGSSNYSDWLLANKVTSKALEEQKETKFDYTPKISVIVATFNTKEEYLKDMIDSVVNQSYSNWELCIADGSTDDKVQNYIKEHYSNESRIKFTKLDDNYGISGNMNKALELATGDYVGLYDHDDILELDCFFEIVSSLQEYRYDVIYTDEDKYDDETKVFVDPNFKPDYSEDLLRSHNYITHFFCVNKKIIDEVGGLRSEYDGSQDYDFIFRCIEKANKVHHIAKILYHWRMHNLSTAQNPESKMYCYEAGKKAIEAHYQRIGVKATVEMMPKPYYGLYHTIYSTQDNPLVSILIPNMNHKDVLKTCVDSLYQVNNYKNFEIIIIENNSTEQEIFDYYDQLKKEYENIKVVEWEGEFNYSAINNFGAKFAHGEYLLLLNNDTEMMKEDALSEMVGCCLRSEVGVVGAKLLYADNTVQHAGVVIGFSGYAGHVFNGIDQNEYGFMRRAIINGNYSSVTGACLMTKKSIFEEVGGLDEEFKVACNDVDYCLKVREKGYLVVYNAFSLWHHYESKSRGYDDKNKEKMWRFNHEVEIFQKKWPEILKNGDPYYNRNFKIEKAPFTL